MARRLFCEETLSPIRATYDVEMGITYCLYSGYSTDRRGKNTQAIVIHISNVDKKKLKKMIFEKFKRKYERIILARSFFNFRSSYSDSLPSHSTVSGGLWGGQKRLHKSQLPYYSPSVVFITKRGNSFSLFFLL